MRKRHGLCLFVAVGALAGGVAGAQNLLDDGGFEIPPGPTSDWAHWVNVPGWQGGSAASVSGGEHGVARPPFEGAQSAAWISGYDVSRDDALLIAFFTQPLNETLEFRMNGLSYAGWGDWPFPGGSPWDNELGFFYDRLGRTNVLDNIDYVEMTSFDPDLVLLGKVQNGQTYSDAVGGGDGWIEVTARADTLDLSTTGAFIVLNRHKFTYFNCTQVDGISIRVAGEAVPIAFVAIERIDPANLRLDWDPAADGLVLEYSPANNPYAWGRIQDSINGASVVVPAPADPLGFFRLKQE